MTERQLNRWHKVRALLSECGPLTTYEITKGLGFLRSYNTRMRESLNRFAEAGLLRCDTIEDQGRIACRMWSLKGGAA